MRTPGTSIALAIATLCLALGSPLPGVADEARLGKVSFPVSCTAAAQKEFEVAMAYYHSFAWPEQRVAIARVLQADPTWPNRYRAYAGALQAAERTGDAKKATFFATRVIEQTDAADSARPEIAQARRVLGK